MICVTQSSDSAGSGFGGGDAVPGEERQPKQLPCQIRRQDEKPRDKVSAPDFCAERGEEIAISLSTVLTEYVLPDPIDGDGYENKSRE